MSSRSSRDGLQSTHSVPSATCLAHRQAQPFSPALKYNTSLSEIQTGSLAVASSETTWDEPSSTLRTRIEDDLECISNE